MRPEVQQISNRMSLRQPQRGGLEILDWVMSNTPILDDDPDMEGILQIVKEEFPSVQDFERDFPSLCFALATGVGKTRLMGAFITYLHTVHGMSDFFVLAPNLTIYDKLITDFTPNTPKYVFKGIGAFANNPPAIVTGDTYETYASQLFDSLITCRINIFNVSKVNTEVRGGNEPRFRRFQEVLGESYFDWLRTRPNLVLLMDESHRYRADAGVRAINELEPVLGLELTATPHVTRSQRTIPFLNVVQDYSLRKAMNDGFVKIPAVMTRENLQPQSMTSEALEQMKLDDGLWFHEQTRAELDAYAENYRQHRVKPFVLVVARDTKHASELLEYLQSDGFKNGAYAGKVIQVDSSRIGTEKDETIQQLLQIESIDNPIEIVIHVDMLKEGWDVNNLYTIIPLRAANARTLIEQTIGRGLRLPYGRRTGVAAVDRLTIVGHDRFQEIVDEANNHTSIIQMQQIVISEDQLRKSVRKSKTVSGYTAVLGQTLSTAGTDDGIPQLISPRGQNVRHHVVNKLRERGATATSTESLYNELPELVRKAVAETTSEYDAGALQSGLNEDLVAIGLEAAEQALAYSIDIPKIAIVPVGRVSAAYEPFDLDVRVLRFQPISDSLVIQYLHDGQQLRMAFGTEYLDTAPVSLLLAGLMNADEVAYQGNEAFLASMAESVVQHLESYLPADQITGVILLNHQVILANLLMQLRNHFRESADGGFETRVIEGFQEILGANHTFNGTPLTLQDSVPAGTHIRNVAFSSLNKYALPDAIVKFESEPERKLARILERESVRWFRPSLEQFSISWRTETQGGRYQPDFCAETAESFLILEVKASNRLADDEVQAKKAAAEEWCEVVNRLVAEPQGTKPWRYALIGAERIADNITLGYLLATAES